MKIFIGCSKHFYQHIPEIKEQLEANGHEVTLPNSYEEPMQEERFKSMSKEEHQQWKKAMLRKDEENIAPTDAALILNLEKNGQQNYIGGATFLEIYTAWRMKKKIYLYNPIPQSIFTDELIGMNPTVINQNINLIQ